jgi:hypothetical protein
MIEEDDKHVPEDPAGNFDVAIQRLVGFAREEGMANDVISDCLKEAVQALGEGLS